MNIDNFDNSVIGNNTTDATLKLKTTGDRYFVFFNAFDVEVIKKPKATEKPQEIYAVSAVAEPKKDIVSTEVAKPIVNIVKAEKPAEAIVSNEVKKPIVKTVKAEKPAEIVVSTEVSKPIVKIVKAEKPTEAIASSEAPKTTIPVKVEKATVNSVTVEKPIVVTKPKEAVKPEVVLPVEPIASSNVAVVSSPEIAKKIEKVEVLNSESKNTPLVNNNPKPIVESVVPNNLVAQTVLKITNRVTPIESPAVLIASQPEGYYIIVNVFAIHSNAIRFVSKLRKKGMFAEYFINPINNYRYVYVSKHDNFQDATQMYASNINGQYFDEFWIMTVNKQNNPNGVAMNNATNSNQVTLSITNPAILVAVIDRNVFLVNEKRKNIVS
jgi:hypothetical protein